MRPRENTNVSFSWWALAWQGPVHAARPPSGLNWITFSGNPRELTYLSFSFFLLCLKSTPTFFLSTFSLSPVPGFVSPHFGSQYPHGGIHGLQTGIISTCTDYICIYSVKASGEEGNRGRGGSEQGISVGRERQMWQWRTTYRALEDRPGKMNGTCHG